MFTNNVSVPRVFRVKECGVGVSLCSDVYDVNLYAHRETTEMKTSGENPENGYHTKYSTVLGTYTMSSKKKSG